MTALKLDEMTFTRVVSDELSERAGARAPRLAWHRAQLSPWRRLRFELKALAVWAYLAWERIGLARAIDGDDGTARQDNNFTLNGAQSVAAVEFEAEV